MKRADILLHNHSVSLSKRTKTPSRQKSYILTLQLYCISQVEDSDHGQGRRNVYNLIKSVNRLVVVIVFCSVLLKHHPCRLSLLYVLLTASTIFNSFLPLPFTMFWKTRFLFVQNMSTFPLPVQDFIWKSSVYSSKYLIIIHSLNPF